MKQYDLENLPFDPALEAGKASKEYRDDDPNRPETEEDGIRAEALRRLRVRQMIQETVPDPKLVETASAYDPTEEAMKRFPNLTREEALKMARAFGF
jgi:hypothetical protein